MQFLLGGHGFDPGRPASLDSPCMCQFPSPRKYKLCQPHVWESLKGTQPLSWPTKNFSLFSLLISGGPLLFVDLRWTTQTSLTTKSALLRDPSYKPQKWTKSNSRPQNGPIVLPRSAHIQVGREPTLEGGQRERKRKPWYQSLNIWVRDRFPNQLDNKTWVRFHAFWVTFITLHTHPHQEKGHLIICTGWRGEANVSADLSPCCPEIKSHLHNQCPRRSLPQRWYIQSTEADNLSNCRMK